MRRPRNKEKWIEACLATVIIFLLVFLVIAPSARADKQISVPHTSPDSIQSRGVQNRCIE